MAAETRSGSARTAGALLLWFAVLGGATAWAVHLFAAWSVEELTCAAGRRDVAGVPLEAVLLAAVILPGVVAIGALAVSVRAWLQTSRAARRQDGRDLQRTRLLAAVGLWANLLFVAIIAFDGVALLVVTPCRH